VIQRIRSLRNRFWYGVSERVRWSRGTFRETAALRLPALPIEQSRRIAVLQDRYQVRFESELGAETSLNNYEYLDILDHAVVADYATFAEPADLITAWFPLLTPEAILAWRLPLKLLRPQPLIRQIHHNLKPGGSYVMVNHGLEEAETAHRLCSAAGLELIRQGPVPSLLARGRMPPPVVSWWRRSGRPAVEPSPQ